MTYDVTVPTACTLCWTVVEFETGPWQGGLRFGRPQTYPAPDTTGANMSHEEGSGLYGQKNANIVV